MPDEILNKIKYLCREIAKVEWSGILVSAPVGEHIGVVGLRAQHKAVHHLGEQLVDAPAQVTGA